MSSILDIDNISVFFSIRASTSSLMSRSWCMVIIAMQLLDLGKSYEMKSGKKIPGMLGVKINVNLT